MKLALDLEKRGIPVLGTSPHAIDLAEDREKFAQVLRDLGLKQPDNGMASSQEEAIEIASRIGYPVLVRPSYVLGAGPWRLSTMKLPCGFIWNRR